uniref:Uncharacterized protein n=1 Tax=Setaria viridis TaxID=4556 RepID=A0A4V6D0N8_SETVI|nr:hypothetical protein SEVIR_9G104400v2 [Setaria viridis]
MARGRERKVPCRGDETAPAPVTQTDDTALSGASFRPGPRRRSRAPPSLPPIFPPSLPPFSLPRLTNIWSFQSASSPFQSHLPPPSNLDARRLIPRRHQWLAERGRAAPRSGRHRHHQLLRHPHGQRHKQHGGRIPVLEFQEVNPVLRIHGVVILIIYSNHIFHQCNCLEKYSKDSQPDCIRDTNQLKVVPAEHNDQ